MHVHRIASPHPYLPLPPRSISFVTTLASIYEIQSRYRDKPRYVGSVIGREVESVAPRARRPKNSILNEWVSRLFTKTIVLLCYIADEAYTFFFPHKS